MELFLDILLAFLILVGLAVIPLGLPGTFVILGAAFLHALATGFSPLTGTILLLLLVTALLAEAAEAVAGLIWGKRFGSGNAGVVAALLGGIAGAILGAPFFFGLGAVPGALCGAFAAAVGAELLRGRPSTQAVQAGWGTFLGRLAGTVIKGLFGLAMAAAALWRVFA